MFKLYRKVSNILILGIFLAVYSSNVLALSSENVTELSLLVQSNDVSFKFPNSVDRTKVSTIEVTWWQVFSEYLEGRLSVAYIELSQDINGSVRAYDTSGYELGVGFRGNIIESDFVNLGFSATFDYMSTDGESSTKKVTEVTWYKYSGSANFELLPLKPVSLLAGISYTSIDGEHKTIDTTNNTVSFAEDEPVGYYAGMSFKSGASGRVNVTWNGGHHKGVYLIFSNRF